MTVNLCRIDNSVGLKTMCSYMWNIDKRNSLSCIILQINCMNGMFEGILDFVSVCLLNEKCQPESTFYVGRSKRYAKHYP